MRRQEAARLRRGDVIKVGERADDLRYGEVQHATPNGGVLVSLSPYTVSAGPGEPAADWGEPQWIPFGRVWSRA